MGESAAVRSVAVDTGINVAFRRTGAASGPALLLLHAWGESTGSFDRLVGRLPPTVRVFAMDLRGHGHSDKPEHGYGLTELADDVRGFMDAVGLDTAVLVGASSGGYVAQQCAVDHPARVEGLVLAGAPVSLLGHADIVDELSTLTDPIDHEWARSFVGWFPVESEVPAWYLDDRVTDALQIPAGVWGRSLAGLTTSAPPLRSGRISARTLAIWGDRDAVIDPTDRAELCTAIPDAQCREYAGVGHLVLWEQPERLAADIAAFLGMGDPAGSTSLS